MGPVPVELPAPHTSACRWGMSPWAAREINGQLEGRVRCERMRRLTAHPWLN